MTFFSYLCAIFVPPLYFILRRRWGAFILNSFFYGLACLFVLSIFGIMIAPFFWLIAASHALFDLRKQLVMEHAEAIATKMAEKIELRSKGDQP